MGRGCKRVGGLGSNPQLPTLHQEGLRTMLAFPNVWSFGPKEIAHPLTPHPYPFKVILIPLLVLCFLNVAPFAHQATCFASESKLGGHPRKMRTILGRAPTPSRGVKLQLDGRQSDQNGVRNVYVTPVIVHLFVMITIGIGFSILTMCMHIDLHSYIDHYHSYIDHFSLHHHVC